MKARILNSFLILLFIPFPYTSCTFVRHDGRPVVTQKLEKKSKTHSVRTANNDRFDFTSMDAFESIASSLLSNQEPTETQWESLETSLGYATLLKSEFKSQGFREPFRLALKSDNESILKIVLTENKYRYLDHYAIWAKKNLKRFPEIKVALVNSYNEAEVISHLRVALPKDMEIVIPRVAVTVFSPDARGYDPIVIDPSLIETFPGKHFTLFLAHEFHHHQRNKVKHPSDQNLSNIEKEVFWILDQLQAEGIADTINMPSLLDDITSLPELKSHLERYRKLLNSAPDHIRQLDKIISDIASGRQRDSNKIHSLIKNTIPMDGHPTGYFMAKTIQEILGHQVLLIDFADPISFVRSYQNAAKTKPDRFPLFSRESMKWISRASARVHL